MRAAVRDTHLQVLAPSARAHGFTAAAGDLFAELGRSLVTPARFTRALRGWEEAPAHAEELAALYSAYHRRLEGLGRRDEQGHARAALDALRERPAAWGARPVLLYGFDDLDPLQLDAVETLAGRAGAEVWVALPYEAGRAAFAGHAATVELLKPLADRHVVLEDRSEHYAGPARRALHQLERRLFEGGGEPCSPNGAVRLLEAGGERAEAELVAAEVLELMREGVAPEDIAVLVREGGAAVEVLAAGLADYGVPVAPDARVALSRTRLGAGLLAFARAALPGGRAADVISWLRTPGKLADPDAADALDARARRSEAASAADARRLWEGRLDELDALAEAAAAGPVELLEALLAEAEAIWTAPHRRRAAVLGPEEAADARTAAELRGAARELRSLAEADPELLAGGRRGGARGARGAAGPPGRGARRRARRGRPGDPRAPLPRRVRLRAAGRRVPAPAVARAVPRRRRAHLAGARQRARAAPPRGRARRGAPPLLRLRVAAGGGAVPVVPLLRRGRRPAAAVAVRGRRARAVHRRAVARARDAAAGRGDLAARHGADAARAAARAGGRASACPSRPRWRRRRSDAVLGSLAARGPEAARAVETFAACGVRWLIEAVLKPQRAEPDPEPMRKGSLAHAVLETTLRGLKERTGSARLGEDTVDAALAELERALGAVRASRGRELATARGKAALRALEEDLVRYLRHEAETGAGMEPEWLEWSFGREGDSHGALALNGSGYSVTGRVDRIDVDGGGAAVIRDYKGKTVHAGARWAQDGRLQAALYALAARELLGLEPAGALYQPIGKGDRRPRGFVAAGVPAATSTATSSRPRRSTPRCWRRATRRWRPRAR